MTKEGQWLERLVDLYKLRARSMLLISAIGPFKLPSRLFHYLVTKGRDHRKVTPYTMIVHINITGNERGSAAGFVMVNSDYGYYF